MHYILESTFARIFLFLELPLQREIHINLHQFAHLHMLLLLLLSSFGNNFILTGHSKQCLRNRKSCGVLKKGRCAQRLTHRTCMGEASS